MVFVLGILVIGYFGTDTWTAHKSEEPKYCILYPKRKPAHKYPAQRVLLTCQRALNLPGSATNLPTGTINLQTGRP